MSVSCFAQLILIFSKLFQNGLKGELGVEALLWNDHYFAHFICVCFSCFQFLSKCSPFFILLIISLSLWKEIFIFKACNKGWKERKYCSKVVFLNKNCCGRAPFHSQKSGILPKHNSLIRLEMSLIIFIITGRKEVNFVRLVLEESFQLFTKTLDQKSCCLNTIQTPLYISKLNFWIFQK